LRWDQAIAAVCDTANRTLASADRAPSHCEAAGRIGAYVQHHDGRALRCCSSASAKTTSQRCPQEGMGLVLDTAQAQGARMSHGQIKGKLPCSACTQLMWTPAPHTSASALCAWPLCCNVRATCQNPMQQKHSWGTGQESWHPPWQRGYISQSEALQRKRSCTMQRFSYTKCCRAAGHRPEPFTRPRYACCQLVVSLPRDA
jgi:hypothetical protein